MNIRPLYPHAALLLDGSRKYIIVCDLHLGLEAELLQKGISINETQISNELLAELDVICKENLADGVVIAGDLKHHVGSITKQEWEEIPRFLNQLLASAHVFLIPGNHDSNVRNLVPAAVSFASPSGMTLDKVLILHGHSMPTEIAPNIETLVMGHVHPTLSKQGSIVSGQPVWVYLQVDASVLSTRGGTIDLVIIPSFNKYLYAAGGVFSPGNVDAKPTGKSGQTHNSRPNFYRSRKSISPITTRITREPESIRRCIITTLDGSIVGDSRMLPEIL